MQDYGDDPVPSAGPSSAPVLARTHRGTTSSALTRLNVKAADLLGIPLERYAHLLGVAPEHLNDDLFRTPTITSIRIVELATVHAPWTDVALLLARQSSIGSLGIWDYLITSAPTPLEGIRDASTYLATVVDVSADSLQVTENGEVVTLSHFNAGDRAHEAACAVRACALGLYQRRLGDAARRHLVPVRVILAARTPRRHDALIELYGTDAIEFEAPVSSITFLASDLKSPTPHAQPGLSTVLRRHADQTLATSIPLHNWLDLFRTALASVHDETAVTMPTVARRLAISTRTLQRRLDAHGTTWSDEVEGVRRDHVDRLLHGSDLSINAIAARSGYADARGLRRAVQRWYGTTPAALRSAGRTHHRTIRAEAGPLR
ncbi:AraC family transcriptional regulator ligand-binding domain-containing protein [Streptomyces sp. NPDC088097]|uniref:AraC family transcriptional regulator ligand-binding domain-containing protein n=1 Tax=Streptomyces sp. NPDC088097 TaxID=3365823 RepID=UPI00381DAFDE